MNWWQLDGAPTADEWQAVFAGAGFVATAIAATFALVQLRNYLKEREDASRPFLVVDYKFRSILLYIEVSNLSGAVATDVHLSVDEPFASKMDGRAAVLNKVFSDRYLIKQLAPGRSIYWTFDRTPDYYAGPYPRNYEVTATYTDPRLRRRAAWWKLWEAKVPVTYVDTFDLNIEQYGDASAESDRENERANVDRRNEKRLENMMGSIGDIAQALDEANSRPPRAMPIARFKGHS